MRHGIGRALVALLVVLVPHVARAQEAAIVGTITDSSGAVLPGVVVQVVHDATGNRFEGVTDARGAFRIPVRPGIVRLTAELSGFASATRTDLEVLLGRSVTVNLQLVPSGVQESVTVTAEAPLISTSSSTISGNIDPRQMSELPNNGRNWMNLALLAPGARSNAASEVPQDRQGYFQINVDGQQVTQLLCCSQTQPRYNRDSIAEFELVSNRFDATQGRSAGMIVNAITKSGTNTLQGTVSGAFRDDSLNAADLVAHRVLPYSNQQIGFTMGGPIRKDRVHYFASYEYEREPRTTTFNSQYPTFNVDLEATRTQHTSTVRTDMQVSDRSHLSVRWAKFYTIIPDQATGGATNHPSTAHDVKRNSDQFWAIHSITLNNRSVNQLKGGYSYFPSYQLPSRVRWNGGPLPNTPVNAGAQGTVRINFSGYSIGSASNGPYSLIETNYALRDDFSTSYDLGGRHDLKTGIDLIVNRGAWDWCNRCNGIVRINARPPANIEQLFPVWNDASTWNVAALSPLVADYTVEVGDPMMKTLRHPLSTWLQDDWKMSRSLTLNLGVRYDTDIGGEGEGIKLLPWMSGDRPSDWNNFGPRLGFAYQINPRTVVRGGYGKYFTQLENDALSQALRATKTAGTVVTNNGRADFALNPFLGQTPTFAGLMAIQCDTFVVTPGCYRNSILQEIPIGRSHRTSWSNQASLGLQRQLGATMALDSNFVMTQGRGEEVVHNINLSYNPATGANYPYTDLTHLPFPGWSIVQGEMMDGWSNYYGWESSFTKRFSNRWQAQATYTLSQFKDSRSNPPLVDIVNGEPVVRPLPFAVAPDVGAEYTLAANDQRHRATFNGIWEAGHGLQISGLYFYGSGERRATSWGGDFRNQGAGNQARLRPDGSIVPRNAFVGDPIHRVDARVQYRLRIVGRTTVDGILEVFNIFNHENYGSYTTQESNASYGQPSQNTNVAYTPRMAQLGFRLAF